MRFRMNYWSALSNEVHSSTEISFTLNDKAVRFLLPKEWSFKTLDNINDWHLKVLILIDFAITKFGDLIRFIESTLRKIKPH